MLRELRIENLAIIEQMEAEFSDGLVTLTGETGAGKSIILNGINLLIGEKASTTMIRDGGKKLIAEGVFCASEEQLDELVEIGIDIEEDDNEIVVRRELDENGRGKAFINGRRVPLSNLKLVMGTLVDLVGQHSHQMLLNSKGHIKLLDRFLGEKGDELLHDIANAYRDYQEVNKKLLNIETQKIELGEKKELFEYQLQEISSVDPKIGEDDELEEEYKKLFNAGKIKENLTNTYLRLKGDETNALNSIYSAKKYLESIEEYGQEFGEVTTKLGDLYYELEDVIYNVENMNSDFDMDEGRLNQVVERLDKINGLKKKYGVTIEEILQHQKLLNDKLSLLDVGSFEIKELSTKKEILLGNYLELAKDLNKIRVEEAKKIEQALKEELAFLEMKDAKFKIAFTERDGIFLNGLDEVEFLISTNLGQSLRPLAKVASGGEISRIMLALKAIFSAVDSIPILIFDEIDTGVGGETVKKIADKLKEIGDNAQVICITHSPAIAAKARQQFYIEKKTENDKTSTSIRALSDNERVEEIARMLAGRDVSEAVLKHARELLS